MLRPGMNFDTRKFLTNEFGTARDICLKFEVYGIEGPSLDAIEKWYYRKIVPGTWMPVLLALLELEKGTCVSVGPYFR